MKIYQLIFLFFSLIIHAQETNYIITYQVNYTRETKGQGQDKLYIDPKSNRNLYIVGDKNFQEIREEDKEPGIVYIYDDSKIPEEIVYSDYKTNLLYSRIAPSKALYFIKEPIPEMNWQLHDESKTNSENVILHKATISFRGRNYTAWYSTEYPIQVGPWKFNNLPGLAFEISEEDNQYHWQLTKIEKNKFKVIPMKYDLSRANETLKSHLKSYQIEVESFDNGMARTISSIPGLEIIDISSDKDEFKNFRSMDLERKYEWEE